jgi:putative membrane protein
MSSEPAPDGAVLLSGHLHPAVLLLRLLDGVQRAIFPLLLGVFVERWFLALAVGLFLLQTGNALLRYLTFQFVLTREELVTAEGVLSRQERRIPVDRIQDLGFESTLLRRVLGLVVVKVETASGKGTEAQLDSLGRREAEELKRVLQDLRGARPLTDAAAADAAGNTAVAPPPQEWLLHRATAGELLLRGFTDLRVGAFAVSLFAALQLADQFGLANRMRVVFDTVTHWLSGFSLAALLLLGAAFVLLVLSFGVITSALASVVMFHDFELTRTGEVLQRRYGLLTTRSKTLPLRRVQRVLVEQNWLRRLFGLAVLRADSAGSSMDPADARGGFDVVVPLAALARAERVLPALLPGVDADAAPFHRVSPRVVVRVFLKGAAWLAVAIAALLPLVGPLALLALLALPLPLLAGLLLWRNVGWSKGRTHLVLQWGILGRYRAVLPVRKIQSVILRRSPLQRLLGLCMLTVYVAGGSPSQFTDLPMPDALTLRDALAADAAVAAGAEWRRR